MNVLVPVFRYITYNILGEDHRFLFLNGQRNKGFEYRHVSIANLIDPVIGDEPAGS